jgi:hypothetical protein
VKRVILVLVAALGSFVGGFLSTASTHQVSPDRTVHVQTVRK